MTSQVEIHGSPDARRVVVAITGASGAIYGVHALRALRDMPMVRTHLVLTKAARATITQETDFSVQQVRDLADEVHSDHDLGAPISSGSFQAECMLVAPCSVKTLSAIANSYAESLVARAADVMLKERRRLVLLLRETPLHAGHLRLMSAATDSGAIIQPPVPAFYTRPETIDDIIHHTIGRACDLLSLPVPGLPRWPNQRGTSG